MTDKGGVFTRALPARPYPRQGASKDNPAREWSMPKFLVTLRQDACLNHYAEIDADTAEQACKIATNAWEGRENAVPVTFEAGDFSTYDAFTCDPDEAENLDEDA